MNFLTFTAPNPGPLTLNGTNSYVTGRVVIDPGPDDTEHLKRLVEACEPSGGVQAILLTHHHPDHDAGAATLSRTTGASVLAFRESVTDGDEVSGLTAVHTPGHARDHLCFWDKESRTLLSGDLIAGEGSIMVSPPDGDLADYMSSLERVRKLNPVRILPGHGPEVTAAKIDEYIAHRQEREAKIVHSLENGAVSVDEVVRQAYDDTPERMLPYAKMAAKAHLIKLGMDLPDSRKQR